VEALQKLIGFLGRHFGPPRLFLLVAAWILALGAWGMVARTFLPMEHKLHWEISLELRAPLYAKYDSGWYLSIIEWGYGKPPPPGNPSSHAYFPLYPVTAKVLHDTFAMDGFHAGLIVSYLCLFLAMPLFWREGRERLGEDGAWNAVPFFLLFPTSFFLAAVYSESLFLLLALLAFRDARRGSVGRAALWAFLLGLTRATALAVAPALFLAALERRRPGSGPESLARRSSRALLLAAVPVGAVFLWAYGIGLVNHEPNLFFRSMQGWNRVASSVKGLSAWFAAAQTRFQTAEWKNNPTILLDYGTTALFGGIAIFQLVRKRWADAAWTGSAIALPMTTGLADGIPRYLMVVYPAYFAMAEAIGGRRLARVIWWAVSGALLLAASARFVNWQWVA
jgi:Mannosyltransferase (PIG-V)